MEKNISLFLEKVNLKRLTQNEESVFRLMTTFKILVIPVITFIILLIFILMLMKLNLIFFEANGYLKLDGLKDAYFSYIFSRLQQLLPFIAIYLVILMLVGFYVSELLLRPFKTIRKYCEEKMEGKNAIYDQEFFTDLKLLTSFSEYFFDHIENLSTNKNLPKIKIPLKFTKIHKPVFEGSFFLQFFLLIVMTSIFVASSIHITLNNLYDGLIKLSMSTLPGSQSISYFLEKEYNVFLEIVIFTLIIHVLLYVALSINLYSKVSTPAFGIFATMRSFLKGNHSTRVHLIGYKHTRGQCRVLNKYLDWIVDKSTRDQG